MKSRATATLIAGFLILALSGCSGGAASTSPSDAADAPLTPVSVGLMGLNQDAAIAMGVEQGFFEEEGLDVSTTLIANPPAGIAAAQSGQLDITYTSTIAMLMAMAQGIDLTVVAAADGFPENIAELDPIKFDPSAILAAPGSGIERPADLEGRSVALPNRNGQIEVMIAYVVSSDGGDPSKIEWIVLDPASSIQALEAGRVDAAGLISPFTSSAMEAGAEFVSGTGAPFFGPGPVALYAAGSEFVEEQPEVAEAFSKALQRAHEYANDHEEEAQKVASELTNVDLEVIQSGVPVTWMTEGVVLSKLQRLNELLVERGFLTEEVQLDDSNVVSAQ